MAIIKIILVFFLMAATAGAENIYISQSGGGAGTSCVDSQSIAWLNTSGSWGSGDGKVSAGDTVYFCGTIETALTIQGSGGEGNPITFYFQPDAEFSTGCWPTSGAINGGTNSYIIIDGGTNGVIKNTGNGTIRATQSLSNGIVWGTGGFVSGIEIKNLIIKDLYVRTSISDEDSDGPNTYAIYLPRGDDNISVHDCTISDVGFAITMHYGSSSTNFYIYNNNFSNVHTMWQGGDTASSSSLTGFYVYNNVGNFGHNWSQDFCTDLYHADGFHTWSQQGGSLISVIRIYNNYIGGQVQYRPDCGSGPARTTSYLYLTDFLDDTLIYNNIFVIDEGETGTTGGIIGFNPSTASTNTKIYNNVFVGQNDGWGTAIYGAWKDAIIKNNIFLGIRRGNANSIAVFDSPANINYNVYNTGVVEWGPSTVSWSTWTGAGYDANSTRGDGLLIDENYRLLASDTYALNKGVTISDFNTDKDGNTRPFGAAWDIGAYEYGAGASTLTLPAGVVIGGGVEIK